MTHQSNLARPMKYVISDKNEVRVGSAGMFHRELAEDFKGKVVRAGYCERLAKAQYRVYGGSIGFRIEAKDEDADLLACPRREVSNCCSGWPIETDRPNPDDHHDSIPVTKCPVCRNECQVVEIITAK